MDASHAHINESLIVDANVGSFRLTGADLTDVDILDVRAIEMTARAGRWRNVRIVGGRIGTLDLSGSDIDSVELRGLRIDYLTLAGATASDLMLSDCVIGTLDMPQARVKRAAFEGCRAHDVDNRLWRIENVDLRGLDAAGYLDPTALRGATMSPGQVNVLAADFARALGIDVQD